MGYIIVVEQLQKLFPFYPNQIKSPFSNSLRLGSNSQENLIFKYLCFAGFNHQVSIFGRFLPDRGSGLGMDFKPRMIQ